MDDPALDYAKHYGNMRFANFTLFSTVSGGLLYFAFAETSCRAMALCTVRVGLSVLGLVMTFALGFVEWRLSTLIVHYQKAIKPSTLTLPQGHDTYAMLIKFVMASPFAVLFVCWGALLVNPLPLACAECEKCKESPPPAMACPQCPEASANATCSCPPSADTGP